MNTATLPTQLDANDPRGAEPLCTISTSQLSAATGGVLSPGDHGFPPSGPRAIKGGSTGGIKGGSTGGIKGGSPPTIKLPPYDPFEHRFIPRDELPMWTGLHGV